MASPCLTSAVPARRIPSLVSERSAENVNPVQMDRKEIEGEDTSVTSVIADFIEIFFLVLALILRFWLKTMVYMARGIRGLYFAERPVKISLLVVGALVFSSLLIQTITGTSCIQRLSAMQAIECDKQFSVSKMCYPID